MRHQLIKKSQWKNALWITRVAVILGVLSICIGLKAPRLFQTKVFAFVAMLAIGLSAVAIITSFWRLQRRSSRLRDIRFWLSLFLNLAVIALVLRMYLHATAGSVDHEPYNSLEGPAGPAAPL